jgi:hypothetical protein
MGRCAEEKAGARPNGSVNAGPSEGGTGMAREAQVQFQNVTKTYQMGEVQVQALSGLDLTV